MKGERASGYKCTTCVKKKVVLQTSGIIVWASPIYAHPLARMTLSAAGMECHSVQKICENKGVSEGKGGMCDC